MPGRYAPKLGTEADRLRYLIDRQEIADVVGRYCERIDAGDFDGVVALFTVDCVAEYGPGPAVHGREPLKARFESSQGRFAHTHHQAGQILVEIDGDRASSIGYATASHIWWDGHRHHTRLQYRDALVRTAAGWLISHRVVLVAVPDDGSDDPQRNWVPRRPPVARSE